MANKLNKKDVQKARAPFDNNHSKPISNGFTTDALKKPLVTSNISQGIILADTLDPAFPQQGESIAIQVNNGTWVSAEFGVAPMTCNRSSPQSEETFVFVDNGDGTFSLKGNNGKFVSRDDGQGRMICNRDSIGGWERFKWIVNSGADWLNGTFSMKGDNDKYVSANGGGPNAMMCDRDSIGGWETFKWIPMGITTMPTPTLNTDTHISDNVPMRPTSQPPGTVTTQSASGSGKYWWLWYLIAAVIVFLYLKYAKK